MSFHDDITTLAGDGTPGTRALTRHASFAEGQRMGIDDMNACGRAGTRGGGS